MRAKRPEGKNPVRTREHVPTKDRKTAIPRAFRENARMPRPDSSTLGPFR